nr:protein-methionine-sulfoxide reductase heme-binding subunit MsrQ [Methylobacillus sp. MM3]
MIINAKIAFFVIALLPLARLVWLGLTDGLGANPVEFVIRSLGTWTLVCLLVTLSVTPIRLIFGINWLVQLRRMMGLFTFFYVCLHLLAYAGLDQWFDWQAIVHDIAKHPYVLVGFSAFVLMIPLAVTSNQAMIRRLRQRWKMLHRLVYLIAILGVTHYWWLVKKDVSEPFIYAVVLFILLAVRVYYKRPRLLGTFWRPDKAATGA